MTKRRAFFTCLIIPLALFILILLAATGASDMASGMGSAVAMLFIVPTLLLSLFALPFTAKQESRKYGWYGTLAAAVLIAAFILTLSFTGKI